MTLSSQSVWFPASFDDAHRRELATLVSRDTLPRIWKRDTSLWHLEKTQSEALNSNLNWLDLPEHIGPYVTRVSQFAAEAEQDGFEDVVFVATGYSSLAAETIATLAIEKRYRRFFVLSDSDPQALRYLEGTLSLRNTLFVFASKSGKHIESHALLLYWLERCKHHHIPHAGRQFVAMTEENSYLHKMAKTYGFRGVFLDSPGLSSRYSSLIQFGLVLAAICRLDPQLVVSRALAMRDLCQQPQMTTNPALHLAAFLIAGIAESRHRFLVLGTRSLPAFAERIGQLVGASTGKHQRFLTLGRMSPRALATYLPGSIAVVVRLAGDEDNGVTEVETRFISMGIPFVRVELNGPEDMGAELFRWEIASVTASATLGVNPFENSRVKQTRDLAARILSRVGGAQYRGTVRVHSEAIDLYAEGDARQNVSTLGLVEALRSFFDSRSLDGYLMLSIFMSPIGEVKKTSVRLQEQLAFVLGIPVLLRFGARSLRGFGHVHGDPAKGLHLILTADSADDIAVPGAPYSFGELQQALAQADFESLSLRQRSAILLHLTRGVEEGLALLEQAVRKALVHVRVATR